MTTFNVRPAATSRNEPSAWIVYGYPTGRTAFTVETESTTDPAEAQRWADSMNAGVDPPGVRISQYADD